MHRLKLVCPVDIKNEVSKSFPNHTTLRNLLAKPFGNYEKFNLIIL